MTPSTPRPAISAPAGHASDGTRLLNEVRAKIAHYVVLPSDEALTAVVLWIVATHAISAWEHATRLAIHSPVKRCGKSRLLEVIEALACRTIATTNISVAALFRVIDAGADRPPTLLIDEADRLFGSPRKDEDNADLIALINNGFRPGKPTIRCVGPNQTPTPFKNFAMVALAGIGGMPDTIEDRAVNITIRRRMPGQQVAKFRLRTDLPAMHELSDQISEWTDLHYAKLAAPVADIPAELEDRAQDAWEPLLAIADAAGGPWPDRARTAAKKLCSAAAEADAETSTEVRLLADIRDTFARMSGVSFLPSGTLAAELRRVDSSPWGEGEFTTRRLAMLLAGFGVKPRHNSDKTARGYHRDDFREPFARYLPSEPSGTVPTGSDLR